MQKLRQSGDNCRVNMSTCQHGGSVSMSSDILSKEHDLHADHLPRQHNPICCILPPHILENLARSRDETRRSRAIDTLSLNSTVYTARIEITQLLRPTRPLRRLRGAALAALAVAPECAPEVCIYDAQNKRRLPGHKVRCTGDPPTNDPAVDEAYDGLEATYNLYCEAYGRDSIDDNGMPLNGSVHYRKDFDNAYWDGEKMVFGDGDDDLFNRFTIAVDVMGHELTHGVTQYEAGLAYRDQSGALNESVSDVFGSLVKQYVNQQAAEEADWLIGAGLLTDKVNPCPPNTTVALRSMKAPGTAYCDEDPPAGLGKDPQPAHMNKYVRTNSDNGGVHINSGIPNHAFYLAAMEIGGYAWDTAGRIWYETLLSPKLRPQAQFQDFANLTVSIAGQLFGFNSPEANAVRNGWRDVGITVSALRFLPRVA
jgi:Zn-dependent metalloprotease